MSKAKELLVLIESRKDGEEIISLIKSKVKDDKYSKEELFDIIKGTYPEAPDIFIKSMIKKFNK